MARPGNRSASIERGARKWLYTQHAGSDRRSAHRRVHRIAYELGTLVVTATCGNPLCVNPRHLTAATKQQIQSRGDCANRNNRNSGVRNVYRDKKRWRAQITERGIAVHIGTFDSVAEADAAVRKV